MELFKNESSDHAINARRNLMGRTHYVDPDTMRFHKSRVMSANVIDNGLLFGVVTSDSLNYENTRRGFRFVVFDIFGTVIERTPIESAFKTSAQARKAMWAFVNGVNAHEITQAGMRRAETRFIAEMTDLRATLEKIEQKIAA